MQTEFLWKDVEDHFNRCGTSSIATVNSAGVPRVSPIGSVAFTGEMKGYYFEKFPRQMRENLEQNPNMCIMAVQSGAGFWMKSLWKGRFVSQPALRLLCRAGERRKATADEIDNFLAKVRQYRFFKGHELLWKDMNVLREFSVVRIEGIEAGRMMP